MFSRVSCYYGSFILGGAWHQDKVCLLNQNLFLLPLSNYLSNPAKPGRWNIASGVSSGPVNACGWDNLHRVVSWIWPFEAHEALIGTKCLKISTELILCENQHTVISGRWINASSLKSEPMTVKDVPGKKPHEVIFIGWSTPSMTHLALSLQVWTIQWVWA